MSEKQCTKCGETKALSEFPTDRRRTPVHGSQCKTCKSAYDRARYEANRGDRTRRRDGWDLDKRRTSRRKYAERHSDEIGLKRLARYAEDPEYFRERSRRAAAKLQSRTADNGRNHGKEWTGPELELLLRDDLSAPQMALMLGRTYASVANMKRCLRDDPRKQVLAGVDRAEF